jgi:hypothetical protein
MSIKNLYPTIKPSLLLDFAKTKRLDPRITFTRASTGACYDGKTVAKAEENILLNTQTFSSWGKSQSTIIPNSAVAPDGTTTASTWTPSAVSSEHYITCAEQLKDGLSYTYSVYAKSASRSWIILNHNNFSVATYTYFNISTGAVGTTGSGVTASIVSVGNNWYRCIYTITHSVASHGTTGVQLYLGNDTGTTSVFTGDGISGVYLWGAQVEQRSSVTAYTPTTSQPITNYIPVLQTVSTNAARFDHDPVTGESEGLLIEEQRTSLLTYSEDFSYWGATNSIVQSNIIVAPDGTMTGDKLVPNTAQDYTFVGKFYMISATTYTFSVYAKAGEYSRMSFWEGNVTGYFATFDLLTGTVVSVNGPTTAKIENAGNGWYRCSMAASYNAITAWWIIKPLDGSTTSPFNATRLGDGYSGIYIWGAQLEASAFPTSYIKTEASQVTRAADFALITGTNFSSWYNQDEGTVYSESISSTAFNVGGSRVAWQIDSGSGFANRYVLNHTSGDMTVVVNNTFPVNFSVPDPQSNVALKNAFAYNYNNFGNAYNGIAFESNLLGNLPIVSRLIIGDQAPNANAISGTIKKIAYYPERLTNIQLENLTK